MSLPVVRLRAKRDKRVRSGHPWVFSNEIEGVVKDLPMGGAVDVYDAKGKHLGRGLSNPNSLIAVRMLSRVKDDLDHPAFYQMKLRAALEHRQTVLPDRSSMRLVYSEGDFIPGLVIDKYDDILVAQITSLGLDQRKELLKEAIEAVFSPRAVVLRSPDRLREFEGLEPDGGIWFGDVPEEVVIEEHGVKFAVRPLGGQKTGHFFDQAENRHYAGQRCQGKSVLDAYSNSGGWALQALAHGAKSATTIDRHAGNCELVARNAELNELPMPDIYKGDAKKTMTAFAAEGVRFGAVFVDPPAFAKNKKIAGAALRGYEEVNTLALQLVEPGGLFCSSSCSFHVHADRFYQMLSKSAANAGVRVQELRRSTAAPDHPTLTAVPETRYLKSVVMRVTL